MSDRRHVSFSSLVASLESGRLSIQKACQEIEACLLTNRYVHTVAEPTCSEPRKDRHGVQRRRLPCRDNHRGFFEQCFAQILKHIFGYDGSTWLDQAAQVP